MIGNKINPPYKVISYSIDMPVAESVQGRRERRADTNVVSIDFSKLIAPSHMFTGDPVYCQQCKAILSHISKITKQDEQQVRYLTEMSMS